MLLKVSGYKFSRFGLALSFKGGAFGVCDSVDYGVKDETNLPCGMGCVFK